MVNGQNSYILSSFVKYWVDVRGQEIQQKKKRDLMYPWNPLNTCEKYVWETDT